MYLDRLAEYGESKREARRQVGAVLDINEASIRNWVEAGERAAGTRPGVSRPTDSEEVRALKRRVAELERANEILKTASAFFAQAVGVPPACGGLDRRLK
jgi:transposase-like protein